MTVLKPCPFCGGIAVRGPFEHFLICDGCGTWAPKARPGETREDAWNRRPEDLAAALAKKTEG